jgi:hypothetical protein
MTIATPGTNTSVDLTWSDNLIPDDRELHYASHRGWTFSVFARANGDVGLVARHRDGRGGVTDYNTVDAAKAAALDAMHPSEAMAWHSEDVPGTGPVHTASWGPLYFAAVTTDDGQLRFGYRVDGDLSDEILNLPGMHDVQQWATGVLIEHYGPVRPVVDVPLPEVADSPAERLSAAFDDLMGHDGPGVSTVEEAVHEAGLRLTDTTPLHRGIADPVTRLSRALYAAHRISLGYDDVTELLRRAGLSLN